jgi:phage shock protein C
MSLTTSHENKDARRPLRRPARGRILGGVAAGIAEHFGFDVTHVRIVMVALSFLGGAAVPLYLAAWALLPAEGSGTTIADEILDLADSHLS